MSQLVDQPTAAPTLKVTWSAFGAALGSSLANVAATLSERSDWLAWLAEPDVRFLIVAAGAAVGSFLAGYFKRERATA